MTRFEDIVMVTQQIQAWGHFRDQGLWDDLAGTFTEDGQISVTWFSGRHRDFIEECRAMHKPVSPRSKHLIGVPYVSVEGDRCVAQTSVQILGRAILSGVACDNTSYARFVDRLERTGGGWRIVKRVAVYEKDRFDPVVPSADYERFMSETDFSVIPEAYRYLGYRLLQRGKTLQPGIIVDGSPEAGRLVSEAYDWLRSG